MQAVKLVLPVVIVLLCSVLFLADGIQATGGPRSHDSTRYNGAPWPSFRHDLQNTGRSDFTGPATPAVEWTFQATDAIASSAVIAGDGTVYFGAGTFEAGQTDSSLYALNADGSLKWRFHANGGVFSSPAIGPDDGLYFSVLDGSIYAVDDNGSEGTLRWTVPLHFIVHRSPTIAPDGTVFVGSLDFSMYAIDPQGETRWTYQTDWCIFSTAAIGSSGEIYFGSKDHRLYCFEDSVTYGKKLWQHASGEFYDGHLVDSSPAIGEDGTLYVGTDPFGATGQTPVPVDTVFFAVNPDGTRKWALPLGDGAESSPAVGPDGTVYIGCYDQNLYAIRDLGTEGVVDWTFPTGGGIDGSPAVDGCGTIYVGSRDSTVYAINPDGSLRWSFPTGGYIEASPALDDRGLLYIGCSDGTFYALGTIGPDVGVTAVAIPDEVEIDADYEPLATVRNYRGALQSCQVSCVIDIEGLAVYADTVVVADLAGVTSADVSFAPWTVGPDIGVVYNVTVATILEGDDNWYNDSVTEQATAVEGQVGVPDEFDDEARLAVVLGQSYPNPFNPKTTIRFELPSAMQVDLRVYDVAGRLVRVLHDGYVADAGSHSVVWYGCDDAGSQMPSGTYFYRLLADTYTETRRMTLIR